MRRHTRPAALLIAALATTSLLATTGCTARAQVAFTVNGTATTMTQVSDLANGCAAALGGTTEVISAAGLVSDMIHDALARQLAASNDISYTDEELRQPIVAGKVSPLAQLMLKDPTCEQLALGLTLEGLVRDNLGVSAYQSAAAAITVQVNPRFGTWNATDLSVDGSGSLSQTDS